MLCDLCQSVIEKNIEDDRIDLPFVSGHHLTRFEAILFEILFERLDRVVNREAILSLMYQHPKSRHPNGHLEVHDKIIDVYVWKIRKKLEDTDFKIVNSFGCGYKLTDQRERTMS